MKLKLKKLKRKYGTWNYAIARYFSELNKKSYATKTERNRAKRRRNK